MNYKIVADSSSNILDMDGINYSSVPLKIITSEKEYTDNKDLDVAQMVNDLLTYKGSSGTSCPNSAEWLNSFEDADAVIGVAISSKLSGSYEAAVVAQNEYKELHPDAKIFILNSKSAGPGMQLILEKIKEMVLQEKSFEEIKTEIEDYSKHTHLLLSLESLQNLANNGRISPEVAKLAGIIGIRLVGRLTDEGALEMHHKCRGEKQAFKTILKEMKLGGYKGGKVRIAHCFNEEAANRLAELIRSEFADCDIEALPCNGLCSFYVENGGLLISYEE